jgi:hypothetical protein
VLFFLDITLRKGIFWLHVGKSGIEWGLMGSHVYR